MIETTRTIGAWLGIALVTYRLTQVAHGLVPASWPRKSVLRLVALVLSAGMGLALWPGELAYGALYGASSGAVCSTVVAAVRAEAPGVVRSFLRRVVGASSEDS